MTQTPEGIERAQATTERFEKEAAGLRQKAARRARRDRRGSLANWVIPLLAVVVMIGLPAPPAKADGTGGSGGGGGLNDTLNDTSGAQLMAEANASLEQNWSGWGSHEGSAADPPSPRANASMTYDATDGYVLLFGGYNGPAHTMDSDTWTYAAGVWTQLNPTTSPSGREGAAMTYDVGLGYVILYGGCTLQSVTSVSDPCSTESSQTWSWSGSMNTWSIVTTSGSPGAITGGSMVYDGKDGYALLFGGTGSCGGSSTQSGPCDQTWELYLSRFNHILTWGSVCSCGPSARSGAAMTYDATIDVVLLFGGDTGRCYASGINSCYYGSIDSDLWKYSGGTWTQIFPGCIGGTGTACPGPRSNASFAYSYAAEKDVLTGGWNYEGCSGGGCLVGPLRPGTALNDTWTLTFQTNGVWEWVETCPTPGSGVSCPLYPRYGSAMSTEGTSSGSELLLFGGDSANQTKTPMPGETSPASCYFGPYDGSVHLMHDSPDNCYLDGSWETLGPSAAGDGLGWTVPDDSPLHNMDLAPSPRTGAVMKPVVGKSDQEWLLFFGGESPNGSFFGDTWGYVPPSPGTYSYWVELWTCGGFNQIFCDKDGVTAPGARTNASLASQSTSAFLYGGYSTAGFLNDGWEFAPNVASSVPAGTWSLVCSSCLSSGREGVAMDFDPLIGAFLLYGGLSAAGIVNDLYSLTSNYASWYTSGCISGPCPTPSAFGGMAFYDGGSMNSYTVLFGGLCTWASGNGCVDGLLQNTSMISLQAGVPVITRLFPTVSPPARANFSMDTANDFDTCSWTCQTPMVLGGSSAKGLIYGDLWAWDGNTWIEECGPANAAFPHAPYSCGIPSREFAAFAGGGADNPSLAQWSAGFVVGGTYGETSTVSFDVWGMNIGSSSQTYNSYSAGSPMIPDWTY
jgi:hypothetical protein